MRDLRARKDKSTKPEAKSLEIYLQDTYREVMETGLYATRSAKKNNDGKRFVNASMLYLQRLAPYLVRVQAKMVSGQMPIDKQLFDMCDTMLTRVLGKPAVKIDIGLPSVESINTDVRLIESDVVDGSLASNPDDSTSHNDYSAIHHNELSVDEQFTHEPSDPGDPATQNGQEGGHYDSLVRVRDSKRSSNQYQNSQGQNPRDSDNFERWKQEFSDSETQVQF